MFRLCTVGLHYSLTTQLSRPLSLETTSTMSSCRPRACRGQRGSAQRCRLQTLNAYSASSISGSIDFDTVRPEWAACWPPLDIGGGGRWSFCLAIFFFSRMESLIFFHLSVCFHHALWPFYLFHPSFPQKYLFLKKPLSPPSPFSNIYPPPPMCLGRGYFTSGWLTKGRNILGGAAMFFLTIKFVQRIVQRKFVLTMHTRFPPSTSLSRQHVELIEKISNKYELNKELYFLVGPPNAVAPPRWIRHYPLQWYAQRRGRPSLLLYGVIPAWPHEAEVLFAFAFRDWRVDHQGLFWPNPPLWVLLVPLFLPTLNCAS